MERSNSHSNSSRRRERTTMKKRTSEGSSRHRRSVSTATTTATPVSPGSVAPSSCTSSAKLVRESRRSFALTMEQIPSSSKLNGDTLLRSEFDDDDKPATATVVTDKRVSLMDNNSSRRHESRSSVRREGSTRSRRTSATMTPKTRSSKDNSNSNCLNTSNHGSRRTGRRTSATSSSLQKKQLEKFVRDIQIMDCMEIPETKVTRKRVSLRDTDAFAAAATSCSNITVATASTTSMHTHASLESQPDDPFLSLFTGNRPSLSDTSFSAFNFDDVFDDIDDEFFAPVANLVANVKKNASRKSSKTKKVASTLSSKDDEFHFVPSSLQDPTQLAPMTAATPVRSVPKSTSRRARRVSLTAPRGRRSRSLCSQDDFGTTAAKNVSKEKQLDTIMMPPLYQPTQKSAAAEKEPSKHSKSLHKRSSGSNQKLLSPRPRRRNSIGQQQESHLLPEVFKKQDYFDVDSHTTPTWSLSKMVRLSRPQSRGSNSKQTTCSTTSITTSPNTKQKQQELLCQNFFGQ